MTKAKKISNAKKIAAALELLKQIEKQGITLAELVAVNHVYELNDEELNERLDCCFEDDEPRPSRAEFLGNIWFNNDECGEQFADDVTTALSKLFKLHND